MGLVQGHLGGSPAVQARLGMEAEDTALTVTMHNGQLYCVQSVEVYLYARGTVHAFIDWNHACMQTHNHAGTRVQTQMDANTCAHRRA